MARTASGLNRANIMIWYSVALIGRINTLVTSEWAKVLAGFIPDWGLVLLAGGILRSARPQVPSAASTLRRGRGAERQPAADVFGGLCHVDDEPPRLFISLCRFFGDGRYYLGTLDCVSST
jgi:hypothetical protein